MNVLLRCIGHGVKTWLTLTGAILFLAAFVAIAAAVTLAWRVFWWPVRMIQWTRRG